MRHRAASLTVVAALAVVDAPAAAAACVAVRAEARYAAYAYDHLVHLTNTCRAAQVCTVATNVNPRPHSVAVPHGETVTVRTFRGSPARVFVPVVSCAPAR
jgi:hypothetical protein